MRVRVSARLIFKQLLLLVGLVALFSSEAMSATPLFTGCPDRVTGSHCDSIYFQVVAIDTSNEGHRNNIRYHLVSGPGTVDERTGLWIFHPELELISFFDPLPPVEIAASIGNDTTQKGETCWFYCGGRNNLPYLSWSDWNRTVRIEPGDIYTNSVSVVDADSCDSPILLEPTITPLPYDLFDFNTQTGELSFATVEADRGFAYTIIVSATDGIDTNYSSVEIEVGEPAPIVVRIGVSHGGLQGSERIINVLINPKRTKLESFDFMIGYDEVKLDFISATMENSPFKNDCDWEYFSYSRRNIDCEGEDCPSGLVRFIGQRDFRLPSEPACDTMDTEQILFSMTWRSVDSYCLECGLVPLRFFWNHCSDNRMIVINRQRTYYSKTVKDWDFYHTGIDDIGPADGLQSFKGAPDGCLLSSRSIRRIDFMNGGLDIVCVDTIDSRGDFDFDGLGYTLADAQVFADFFTQGEQAFEICFTVPDFQEECLEQMPFISDINQDKIPFMIEDFTSMVAIINGSWPDYLDIEHCLNPERYFSDDTARVYHYPGSPLIRVEADDTLAALLLHIRGEVVPKIAPTIDMRMDYQFDGEFTKIFIYSLAGNTLPHEFSLAWTGSGVYQSVETATYSGRYVHSKVLIPTAVESDPDNGLPESFALHQNYPNPFNPTTQISFDLPEGSLVTLSVYNVLGRLVTTVYEGRLPAGSHLLTWDGLNSSGQRVTSGVYLYRLKAGEFVSSKKMLLLK